ncbi:hypothetical protein HDU98_009671 [Podochytrium sp. JEL0797]|nr:hypothetical protein HDU98_009671 [Podochytrium sp. JEL0797]
MERLTSQFHETQQAVASLGDGTSQATLDQMHRTISAAVSELQDLRLEGDSDESELVALERGFSE